MKYKVLTIAGSDCSGGAGIQADLKTITAFKMYGMSAITAITAQNTMGVEGIMEVSPEMVGKQLDMIFQDIYPDAVKIGMVSNPKIIHVIAEKLKEYKACNIVVDPVMVSTSGSNLSTKEAVQYMVKELFPIATVITPNLKEAEVLSESTISSKEEMIQAAQKISNDGSAAVLVKGGHLKESASDVLIEKGNVIWYEEKHINNENTHGTGCTLSSAIACGLAKGQTVKESIAQAKGYVTGAIGAGLDIGKGNGPLNHIYQME